jgi:hypothetical protein
MGLGHSTGKKALFFSKQLDFQPMQPLSAESELLAPQSVPFGVYLHASGPPLLYHKQLPPRK